MLWIALTSIAGFWMELWQPLVVLPWIVISAFW
jgi:hypothetical protein